MKENSRCLDAKVESCNLRTVISFRVTPRSLDAGHVLPQKGHGFAMLDSVELQLPIATFYRELSHCGECAQNLQTRGFKIVDDITLVPKNRVFCINATMGRFS